MYLSGEKHTTHNYSSTIQRSTAAATTITITTSSSDHAIIMSTERVEPDLGDRTCAPPVAAAAWSPEVLTPSAPLPLQSVEEEAKRPLLSESHLNDNDNGMMSGARRVGSDAIVHISCPETNFYKRIRMGFTRMAVECLLAIGLIEICAVANEELILM